MKYLFGALALSICCWTLPGFAQPLINPGFEEGVIGKIPPGWQFNTERQDGSYLAQISQEEPQEGRYCAHLLGFTEEPSPSQFASLSQKLDARPYRGKRIALKATIKTDVVKVGNQAQMWLRVQRPEEQPGFFDNMSDRPITSDKWQTYEIIGEVTADAEEIRLGVLLKGQGQVWIDDVSLTVLGSAGEGNAPATSLSEQELQHLIAFTRLYGYLRFFHPSDENSQVNWEDVALAGVQLSESAQNSPELQQHLEKLLKPIAPTFQITADSKRPLLSPDLIQYRDNAKYDIVGWNHYGVGLSNSITGKDDVYLSDRIKYVRGNQGILPDPDQPLALTLTPELTAWVPLTLYTDGKTALPRMESVPVVKVAKPRGWRPNGLDRTTRLANIVITWNILQHFYPYFGEVKTDWAAQLPLALQAAAQADSNEAFLTVMRRLIAALHDGHGTVYDSNNVKAFTLPILWDWVENQLVITHVLPQTPGNLKRGDVVQTLDGQPVTEWLKNVEPLISGATPQWIRLQALDELAAGHQKEPLQLGVVSSDGTTKKVSLSRLTEKKDMGTEPRPANFTEMTPGVFYLNLRETTDESFKKALPRLQQATGLIFDLRGYPHDLTPAFLGHLSQSTLLSPQWQLPLTLLPDRREVNYELAKWEIKPVAPFLTARKVFLANAATISYAETLLSIAEQYKLGHIVGQPTAGTNGNINPFELPGGFVVYWTGVKVLRHDGGPHHGVGIQPEIKVERTRQGIAAGHDELLLKALELLTM